MHFSLTMAMAAELKRVVVIAMASFIFALTESMMMLVCCVGIFFYLARTRWIVVTCDSNCDDVRMGVRVASDEFARVLLYLFINK